MIITACPERIRNFAVRKMGMRTVKRTWLLTAVGILLGALAGFGYWYGWGCSEGCAITSSPVNSTLYGALMGALLVNAFRPDKSTKQTTNNV